MAKPGHIVRYTAEQLERMPSETDWAKVEAMTEEELERLIAEDPDDVMLTDEELANGIAGFIVPVDVAALRERMGMSQSRFAATFGVSVWTLRNWEQGRRQPEGAARVLLQVIAREPDAVRRALGMKAA